MNDGTRLIAKGLENPYGYPVLPEQRAYLMAQAFKMLARAMPGLRRSFADFVKVAAELRADQLADKTDP